MTFKDMVRRAKEVRALFAAENIRNRGKEWDRDEYVKGFVGDVGALMKLTMAKDGLREIDDVDEKLKHEIIDCFWSILTIADKYGVDIEQEFANVMDQLEKRAKEHKSEQTSI